MYINMYVYTYNTLKKPKKRHTHMYVYTHNNMYVYTCNTKKKNTHWQLAHGAYPLVLRGLRPLLRGGEAAPLDTFFFLKRTNSKSGSQRFDTFTGWKKERLLMERLYRGAPRGHIAMMMMMMMIIIIITIIISNNNKESTYGGHANIPPSHTQLLR